MTFWTSLFVLLGTAFAAEPVPLNKATAEQLASLDGVERPTAEAVVTASGTGV